MQTQELFLGYSTVKEALIKLMTEPIKEILMIKLRGNTTETVTAALNNSMLVEPFILR
jgi:hypothetical protein